MVLECLFQNNVKKEPPVDGQLMDGSKVVYWNDCSKINHKKSHQKNLVLQAKVVV
jgi:hypothetical protein